MNRGIDAFPVGAQVVTAGRLIVLTGQSPALTNMIIDGNRSSNNYLHNWALQREVHFAASIDAFMSDVSILDSPGNAITEQGLRTVIVNSQIDGANCAAVHLSNSRDLLFDNVTVRDTNETKELCGHSVGGIEWSLRSKNVTITNSHFESIDAPAINIGSISEATGTAGITVTNTTFVGNGGVLYVSKRADVEAQAVNLLFENNSIHNSGDVTILNRGDYRLTNFDVINNDFYGDSQIDFSGDLSASSTISNNTFHACLLGDVNLDYAVDFFDIMPFIAVLADGAFLCEADCDENGAVDFFDISPFIAILGGP